MTQITVYTVSDCADCGAVGRLLTSKGAAFTEKNVREDPAALAGMQARANVRIAPATVIGDEVFFGFSDDQRPGILAALARNP